MANLTGRDLDVAVARAIGLEFNLDGDYVRVGGVWRHLDAGTAGWSPLCHDQDALIALDIVLARQTYTFILQWLYNSSGWYALLGEWPRAWFGSGATRAEAISHAIVKWARDIDD